MYQKVAAILFPITLIGLIAAGAWGYQENQDKNSILIKAENQYQRAFHELNDHMDKLSDEMGKSLALNTRRQMSTSMTNIWRLAYVAQNDLGQLPLTLMPFDKTEQFVNNIGRFAYTVGVRDLDKKPLTEQEWKTLQTLYNRSQEIRNDLQSMQRKVLDKNLRWMDVELALATEDKKMDNTIIDGFKKVNRMVEEYSEVDWGPTVNYKQVREKEKFKKLTAPLITKEQAKQKVAKALDQKSTKGMTVVLNKKGDYQTYSVRYEGKNKTEVYADLTSQGGYMVWMLYDRPVKEKRLSIDQAQGYATKFLERIQYKDMVPISYDETGNLATINFVHRQSGVYIYPEAATVKVALDNGEITGLQADEYVFNKIKLPLSKPKLSLAQAKKEISPRLDLQKDNLAVIYNDEGKEVLCYEFLGRIPGEKGSEQYRIFINADTGNEEFIEKVKKADIDQA
ncbi:germination protein YpeB [Hazenella coriacea]|uniref:Spore germination protein n=1 Tax=Hazenella coriacea TaxID=1179467 RepID=A0A4R3L3C7_9BACL|nr:germination protein YpeB [Hazenella coriacea]TCS93418.1 spore germination protein [Hazenella coriacea]